MTCKHLDRVMIDESGICATCGKIVYDDSYFLDGRNSGLSLYENYRWLPNLTLPMVQAIIDYCGIEKFDHVLDFGCARGYIVRAFRELGYDAFGYDISEWALENADSKAKKYLRGGELLGCEDYEWIIVKDVLEHVHNVVGIIEELQSITQTGIFAVVPLALIDGQPYVVPDYEKDVTHIHRLSLASWAHLFASSDWSVTVAYRVPGVKDNYAGWEFGNGFITARRLP